MKTRQNSTALCHPDTVMEAERQVAIPPHAQQAVSYLFKRLSAIFPAFKQAFPTRELYAEARQVWLETLVNEGITAVAQIEIGLRAAAKSANPFFPSVGQFIDWCRSPNLAQYGLPSEDELYRRLVQFQRYGMVEIHRFKFNSAAEYWLITDLHVRCRLATEADLRREIRASLKTIGERLAKGETIPEPQIALPPTPSFKPWEQQRQQNLSGIAKCRNALRGRA